MDKLKPRNLPFDKRFTPFTLLHLLMIFHGNSFNIETLFMTDRGTIAKKIIEVKEEMKRRDIWKHETPAWVHEFEKIKISTVEDFIEWLQFVYLPNRMQDTGTTGLSKERNYIVPQAVRFFGSDLQKGKLLQLLIELDALS